MGEEQREGGRERIPSRLHAVSVEYLIPAQVMVLQSLSLSPVSGSVLIAQSLESSTDSVSLSLSLSAPPALVLCVCLSLSLKNK